MKRPAILTAAGLGLTAALWSTSASATFVRTFVSGTGSDSNPCTRTRPCLTFAFAITQTAAGGEIDVLDPGGYGPVIITQAISIVNDGVGTVGVRALSGGNAITINAGASDAVSLRGLTIEGAGVGANGIVFNTGQSLTIANSVIRHFTGDGIDFSPNATSNLAVSSTLVADNGFNGISVSPSRADAVTAIFNRVEANNNAGNGINVSHNSTGGGAVNATVTDSVAAKNAAWGFAAVTSMAPTEMMVFRSVAASNGNGGGGGITAQGPGAEIRIAQSAVTSNTKGWEVFFSGVVLSAGDNTIEGNQTNETAPPTYTKK